MESEEQTSVIYCKNCVLSWCKTNAKAQKLLRHGHTTLSSER